VAGTLAAVAGTRRRLGVALLLDPPVADAVDGLRRAVGDPSLGRIGPHVTLVPPVNVRTDELPAALAVVRRAAARQGGPLRLNLGPTASFLPDNPVLYLEVGGDLDALRTLRDDVFAPPLARPLSWPWVPHVTVADTGEPDRIAAAVRVLDRFAMVADIEGVVVLQEGRGRVWAPLADMAFGPPAVVGRGGLVLEITRGRLLDPEARQMLDAAAVTASDAEASKPDPPARWLPLSPVVVTGRREGQVVAAGLAWRADDGGQVAVVVAAGVRRQGIGGIMLAHLEAAVRAAGWDSPVLHAHGPAGFYQARSGWAVTRTRPPRRPPTS
jgi:2'-5' RNA ligase